MDKTCTTKLVLLVSLLIAVCIAAFAPTAYAAAPGIGIGTLQPEGISNTRGGITQDPTWLAKKRAHLVVSGLQQNQPKGTKANPHTLSQPYSLATAPAALTLTYQFTGPVFEPGDGDTPNYGAGTPSTDDASQAYGYSYYNPSLAQYNCAYFYCDMVRLCGPGATDTALWYWPAPNNSMNTNNVTDSAPTHQGYNAVTTTWNGTDSYDGVYRMRGYMAYLAWKMQVPTWETGMQDQTNYPTAASTLWKIQRALNWESSGNNQSTWVGYFYVNEWWNQHVSSDFHNDVVTDISGSSVPVVAEVNAGKLPNWNLPNQQINHFITIIGYNDTNNTYTYLDTCGVSTRCNSGSGGSDGGIHTVLQNVMWTAITSVPVNTADNATGGDGGWVW